MTEEEETISLPWYIHVTQSDGLQKEWWREFLLKSTINFYMTKEKNWGAIILFKMFNLPWQHRPISQDNTRKAMQLPPFLQYIPELKWCSLSYSTRSNPEEELIRSSA